ncbi:Uu.00g039730.m01.CDS01 [Anthostomella pinea]|uniref:Uu.00g039730.m01.CDS01 n=1 Tax=Anthostomella pinea TaxID=933095 RepID=A0AAI8YDV0_9PEZI|nr:Uu.00g039730.m01.CDS01 [Anthostomella pinea]
MTGQEESIDSDQTRGIETETEDPAAGVEDYSTFSAPMRTYPTYLLGFVIIISTLMGTVYFPLIPMLSRQFGVSIQAINLTVTTYAVFQAISPIIFASLADAFGRRPVMLSLTVIYGCTSLGLTLNKGNYAALVALRSLQSIGGSATSAVTYGIVADVAVVPERGAMLGPMLSTCNGISAVGPMIGGAVALRTNGYTWVFCSLSGIAAVCFLLVGFTLPETARSVVGNGSVPARGLWRTWWSFTASQSRPAAQVVEASSRQSEAAASWKLLDAFASLRMMFYPDAAAVLAMIASSYCIGLAFLPGLAGMTLGGVVAGKLVDRNYTKTARKHGLDATRMKRELATGFPIEEARYRNIVPFIVAEVALVVAYGWAVQARAHPAIPLVIQFFVCVLSTLLSHTASALLVDIFPDKSSTAYTSSQVARCGLSAASAAAIQPLIDAIGRGWYFTAFGLFVLFAGVGSVLVSRVKGSGWRRRRQCRRFECEV